MAGRVWICVVASLALGCASGGGGGGTVQGAAFPSARELERVEQLAPPSAAFDSGLRQTNDWVIGTEPPARLEMTPWVATGHLGRALASAIEADEVGPVPTQGMHCLADELARFDLETGGRPDHSVMRFITAACNAPVVRTGYHLLQGEVGDEMPDEVLFEQWSDSLLEMIRTVVTSNDASAVGIGYARGGGKVRIYIAYGKQLVELEPVATDLERGQPFELRGRSLVPAQSISASINRGRYSVAGCESVGETPRRRFHFVCHPDPTDYSARVSLSIHPPDRFLGTRGLDALVWPRGPTARAYERIRYATPRVVDGSAPFAEAFVEELNAVRSRAGMRPVALEVAQSETATHVAPHYFAALIGNQDERVADLAALGLLAGWDVDGYIRDGNFTSAAVAETEDLTVLLGSALEDPVGRLTLLDPDADRMAVGPIREVSNDVPVIGAVVTSYQLYPDGAERDAAESLFGRLAREREQRGLPAPYRLVDLWLPATESAREVRFGARPDQALDDLLGRSAHRMAQDVMGWYAESSELDEFEFPEKLLNTPRLGVAFGASPYKPPESAWARYVVLVVTVLHRR